MNLQKLAVDLAFSSPRLLGAVISYKGYPVAKGIACNKTHPLQARWGKNPASIYLHAEIDALVRFHRDFGICPHKSSIHVARVFKKGGLALARPCAGCMGALLHYGVRNIHYTTPNGWSKLGE